MKLTLTLTFFHLFSFILVGQTQFWGLTSRGGVDGAGSIFYTNGSGNALQTAYNFEVGYDGYNPQYNNLLSANNGKLYGMVAQGGIYGSGVIYEYNPIDSSYLKIHDFSPTDGIIPKGGLIQLPNGKLYGMTYLGGANSLGTLFCIDPTTLVFTLIHSFTGLNTGSKPQGGLLYASDGMLYGVTTEGGTNSAGVLFQLNPLTNAIVKKHDFFVPTGSNPVGQLVQGTDGMIYGVTQQGGSNFSGTIFRYDPVSSVFTHMLSFTGALNGAFPFEGLIQATNGLFYGLTQAGGANGAGALYSFNSITQSTNLVYSFAILGSGGNMPMGKLYQHSNGKLYGVAGTGGVYNNGTIFEFSISTGTYLKIFDFNDRLTGKAPWAGLALASDGNLYGVTNSGGYYSYGIFFRLNPSTGVYSKRFEFGQIPNGQFPEGSLLYGSDGMLYGTTEKGGTKNAGTIFRFNPITRALTKLMDFDTIVSGRLPTASLIQTPDGKLYGMTNRGGTSDQGVLFRFDPVTLVYTKLMDFTGPATGQQPTGSLLLAPNGRLYGTTDLGGTGNSGILFEFNPSNGLFIKKLDFATPGVNGRYPYGTLILANNGKLYGTTKQSNSQAIGVIFEYNYISNTYFALSNASPLFYSAIFSPILTQAINGKIYGYTLNGGLWGNGTIFELNLSNNALITKYHFSFPISGSNPYGGMIQASNGKLYGTTNLGGGPSNSSFGTLFEYDYVNDIYSLKHTFGGIDGSFPNYLRLVEIPIAFITGTLPNSICAGTNISIPFTFNDTCNSGNIFTAQLSDANGSFASPTTIGTLSALTSDTIQATIASTIAAGSNYRIRVLSSSPAMTSTVSSIPITVFSSPSISVSSNMIICSGDTTQIIANSGYNNFSWTPAININASAGDTVTVWPAATTTYSVSVTDNNNCTGTASAVINVQALPSVSAPDTILCTGECMMLNATGAVNYSWSPSLGLSNTMISNPVCCSNSSITYHVVGTDSLGCAGYDSSIIQLQNLPFADAGRDSTICEYQTVQLLGSGTGSPAWSPSVSIDYPSTFQPFATPSSTTTYILSITDSSFCIGRDTVQISVLQAPAVFAGPDTSICIGENITLSGTGGQSCVWSPSNSLNSPTIYAPIATPTISTNYIITVTDSTGCTNSDSISVIVTPLPLPPIITQYNNGLLSSYTYGNQWLLNGNIIPGAIDSLFVPLVNGNYEVLFTDSSGCTSQSAIYYFGTVNSSVLANGSSLVLSRSSEGIIIDDPYVQYGFLSVYDFSGRLLEQMEINTNAERTVIYLPAYTLPGNIINWTSASGSYTIK